jgi:glutamate dehydrogenase (NAD(P)+)
MSAERCIVIDLKQAGARALLVIDRTVKGRSFGGLRQVSVLDQPELLAAAESMTLKNAFVGLALGGAKAALELPFEAPGEQRTLALRELGRRLRDVIRSDQWIPATDMGIDLADLRLVFQGAGLERDLSTWQHRSHLYTGWSLIASAQALCRHEAHRLEGQTISIQGYGRVGRAFAQLAVRAGARVTAIATRYGAARFAAGFDLDLIDQLRTAHMDRFVLHYPGAEPFASEALIGEPVDLFLPAARAFAISVDNASQLKARWVICAANAAVGPEAEKLLLARGTRSIPDFVANCGGVAGSVLERYIGAAALERWIRTTIETRVTALIDESVRSGRSIGALARDQVERTLGEVERDRRRWPSRWYLKALRALPPRLRQPIGLWYARNRLLPS